MTEDFASQTASPGTATTESDWTDQVTDLVVHVVDTVHARTTGPILKIARIVVYGLVALVVLGVVSVVGLILAGRAIALLPIELWISYLGLGAVMVLIGSILWRLRRPPA